uniref:Pectinesterase A n=1 Tax=Lygus hesperus TaxID=30085 RepID=A0A0A9Z7U2_LYGHE
MYEKRRKTDTVKFLVFTVLIVGIEGDRNIYDRSLSCYECSTDDTLNCNSPMAFDTKIYMTTCSEDAFNESDTTPDSYDIGPPYHPTKTHSSQRKMIESKQKIWFGRKN